jgi:anti-sigma regulatory factor (Ser/Thr protein kinase)
VETRVRMVAQPASVPAVRRFVDDALTDWGRTDLIDDVGLSVTELATNATLHTDSSFFDVELRAQPDAVRVAVVDGGQAPARLIASRAELAELDELAELEAESMTGRGLFIVSALASTWGIEDLPGGTRVWADFASGPECYEPTRPEVAGQAPEPAPPQAEVTVIELPGCPPELLLAHDDNLADVARELKLFGASHDDPDAVRAAEQIVEVVRLSALSWDAARLVARQALHDRQETVDVAIASADVEDLPRKVRVLRQAVGAAEAMARRGELMTMPAAEPLQRWRDWVEAEMVGQATGGRTPVRFADWV